MFECKSSEEERVAVGRPWSGVPFYWLMLSVAAWQAVKELAVNPFLWRKTPHAPSAAPADPSEQAGNLGQQQEVQTQNHGRADRSENADRHAVHVITHDAAL